MSRVWGWVLAVTGFVACPCHLMGYAIGENPRFPRSGTGHHQNRSLGGSHCLTLGGVEIGEQR